MDADDAERPVALWRLWDVLRELRRQRLYWSMMFGEPRVDEGLADYWARKRGLTDDARSA